jgi:hypothetical protein
VRQEDSSIALMERIRILDSLALTDSARGDVPARTISASVSAPEFGMDQRGL